MREITVFGQKKGGEEKLFSVRYQSYKDKKI